MVQRLGKTKVRVIPREGEVEITLNINISLDGKVVALADNADVTVTEEEEKAPTFIPQFLSGGKLKFGKKE